MSILQNCTQTSYNEDYETKQQENASLILFRYKDASEKDTNSTTNCVIELLNKKSIKIKRKSVSVHILLNEG